MSTPAEERARGPRATTWYACSAEEMADALVIGLEMPDELPEKKWFQLGYADVGSVAVRVEVFAAPARFYRFETSHPESGQRYRLTTGSGALREYWPAAQRIAEGMLEIERLPVKTSLNVTELQQILAAAMELEAEGRRQDHENGAGAAGALPQMAAELRALVQRQEKL